MNSENFYKSLQEFLKERRSNGKTNHISEKDNLFDLGYIDSLNVVELILFIEEKTGKEIPIENYTPRTFHTMKQIFDTFFDNEEGARVA
jgi:acyl carrier protein